MHIEDALAKFVQQLKADGRSIHTRQQYARHIGVLAAWLALERPGVALEQLDHEDIATFVNSPTARNTRDGRSKKANTTNALRTSVRCFFAYMHAAGMIPTNPARLLRRALCSPGPPRAMSHDEAAALLKALRNARGRAAERDHVLFEFMLGTGIRLSSALALRVQDVDLERAEVTLHNVKGGRTDLVFLSHQVRHHLTGYLRGQRSGIMFPGPGGRALSRRHAHRRFAMWLKAAGVGCRLSPHSLRHSFGMKLYRGTRDVLLVQRALGHRSVLSTMVYMHAVSDDVRRALA